MRVTRVQLDELRCIAQGRPHHERPGRNRMRDTLATAGLIVWWVDPRPTTTHNESKWMLTGMGQEQYCA